MLLSMPSPPGNKRYQVTAKETLWDRIYRALAPVAGGMLLDGLDVATFGPQGLYAGWLVGAVVGWWLAGVYGFRAPGKLMLATAAAIYLSVPFTEPFPVATAVSALARFFGPPANRADAKPTDNE